MNPRRLACNVASRVVLDTNGLLMPFETGIRLERELERLLGTFEILVPEAVMTELGIIAATAKGRRRDNAKAALSLAAKYTYRKSPAEGDRAILAVARQEGALLLTNDRELIREAMKAGIGVVRMKGKGHLIVETAQGEVRG